MPLRIPPDSQDGPQTKTLRGLNRQGSTTRIFSDPSGPSCSMR